MILGVDVGTYSVKTSNKVTFFSKFTQEESFTEINKININGSSYNIGEGEFSTDWDKSKKGNTLILLYSAIYKSTKEDINQVVLGLPVQQYKKNKNNLIELIENNKCAKVENRNLIITDVTVAPEGASSYYSIDNSSRDEIGNKQLIIIDIGGRTTDIIVFQNKIIIDVKTIPIGMLNIYQEIIDTVNTKYTESLVLEDGEGILKDGLFLKGKQQDINFVQPILKRNFNSVFKEIQLKYNTNKGYVYLTGGGSILLKLPFKNRLSNLLISNNPIFDNAIGFGKVGESLWLE
ncbi:UNVERIFIED_ORG: ATPase [Clostridium botulinum]